jgi:hypothetical protein
VALPGRQGRSGIQTAQATMVSFATRPKQMTYCEQRPAVRAGVLKAGVWDISGCELVSAGVRVARCDKIARAQEAQVAQGRCVCGLEGREEGDYGKDGTGCPATWGHYRKDK